MTRRRFLGGTMAAGGAAAVGGPPAPADAATAPAPSCPPPLGVVTVGRDDPRYPDLTARGTNRRFTGRPESVRVVGSAEQIRRVVEQAVRQKKRIVVRSGGHCFENFVDDPDVQVVIDVSEMKAVYFDPEHQAFAVESGATLGQVYRTLQLGWGVTIPGGTCPDVGIGGHVAGGGYGTLSRLHGMAADHLYGVEAVVVDRSGRARLVVATRRATDPHRELWWAHTGGGGGNFGVVTRYLFRSPGAGGSDPAGLLPRPPATLLKATVTWQWKDLTRQAFTGLIHNFGAWQERYGNRPEFAGMTSGLVLNHRVQGQIQLEASLDGTLPDAAKLFRDHLAAVTANVDAPHTTDQSTASWLSATLYHLWPGTYSFKTKSAFLRKPWSDAQVAILHTRLSQGGAERYGSTVYLTAFGGKINSLLPSATSMPHRDTLLTAEYETLWFDAKQADAQLAWIRALYKELYAATGGVPVPDDDNSGAYINYPDADLADPEWNTSGVPWHTFYYGDNYPRLQKVKAAYDPGDVFHHPLSVRLPD
ncbi:FAD-binding oxidoreductase [Streptomyces sp. NPDC020801]|uniref:FAD-binding oxidoreductase n=1 Tax=unclassified Streptomyces TaxID=2593676 RepID=UPI0037A9D754